MIPIYDELLFLQMLERFVKEDFKGREALATQQIGLTSPEEKLELPNIKYMSITAQSVGKAQAPYMVREPLYWRWEEYV